jgi:hypothetical protein
VKAYRLNEFLHSLTEPMKRRQFLADPEPGESLEDFQKTRNAQMLYSVAGQDSGKINWERNPSAS